MSVKIQTTVWDSDLPSEEKYILLALADWADDDGNNIYPSVERLAWKTNCGKRTILRHIKSLRSKDILVPMGRTPWRTVLYRVDISKLPKRAPYQANIGANLAGAKLAPSRCQNGTHKGANLSDGFISISISDPSDSLASKKNGSSPGDGLLPNTPGALLMFDALAAEAKAKGRRAANKFATLAQKEKFLAAETALPEAEIKRAIQWALEQGKADRSSIVNVVSAWAKHRKRQVAPTSGKGKRIPFNWTAAGGK